jgi:hypothetical protein
MGDMMEIDREFLQTLELFIYDKVAFAWTRFSPTVFAAKERGEDRLNCTVDEVVDAMWELADLQLIEIRPLPHYDACFLLRRRPLDVISMEELAAANSADSSHQETPATLDEAEDGDDFASLADEIPLQGEETSEDEIEDDVEDHEDNDIERSLM